MLGPHISLLSVLFSVIQGYLPSTDLTNSIISPYESLIEKEPDALPGESGSAEIDEPSASPYRNRLTFRRRNLNSGNMNGGAPNSPFSRMNYRGGYGSNRRSFNFKPMGPSSHAEEIFSTSPYTNSYNFNGYGNSYTSGILGNRDRNFGFFGSTAALRNKSNFKRFPNYYTNRQTNDLMNSFTPDGMVGGGSMGGGTMPSHKFGGPNTFIPQIPERELPNQYFNPYYPPEYAPYQRGEYGSRIMSNRWNDKANVGEIDNSIDGYAANAKTQKTQKSLA